MITPLNLFLKKAQKAKHIISISAVLGSCPTSSSGFFWWFDNVTLCWDMGRYLSKRWNLFWHYYIVACQRFRYIKIHLQVYDVYDNIFPYVSLQILKKKFKINFQSLVSPCSFAIACHNSRSLWWYINFLHSLCIHSKVVLVQGVIHNQIITKLVTITTIIHIRFNEWSMSVWRCFSEGEVPIRWWMYPSPTYGFMNT